MYASGMRKKGNDQVAAFQFQVLRDVQNENIGRPALQALSDLRHAIGDVDLGVQDKAPLLPYHGKPAFHRGFGIVLVEIVEDLFAHNPIKARLPDTAVGCRCHTGGVSLRRYRRNREGKERGRPAERERKCAARLHSLAPSVPAPDLLRTCSARSRIARAGARQAKSLTTIFSN